MINLKDEINAFKPIDLGAVQNSDKQYTESMKVAFALYNKALQKIEEGYEDMAKNDLKKSIQLFPSFNDAILLLGICTFAGGDRIGAVRVFNSIKDPSFREKGMAYLDHLAALAEKNSYSTPSSGWQSKSDQRLYEIMGGYDVSTVPQAHIKAEEEFKHAISKGVAPMDDSKMDDDEEDSITKINNENHSDLFSGTSDKDQDDNTGEEIVMKSIDSNPAVDYHSLYRTEPITKEETDKFVKKPTSNSGLYSSDKKNKGVSERKEHQDNSGKMSKAGAAAKKASQRQNDKDNDGEEENAKGTKVSFFSMATAILMIFSIVIAVLYINAISDNRELKEKLAEYEAGGINIAGSATPDNKATPSAGKTPGAETTPGADATPDNSPTSVPTAVPTATPPSAEELRKQAEAAMTEIKNDMRMQNYYDVVLGVIALDMSQLTSAEKSEMRKLYDEAIPLFSVAHYQYVWTAEAVLNNSQSTQEEIQEVYETLVMLLQPVYEYNKNFNPFHRLLFYLGKAYDITGDVENAKKYYRECIEDYSIPETDTSAEAKDAREYVSYAKYRWYLITGEQYS